MSVMTSVGEIQQQIAAKPCRFCGSASLRTFVDLGMSPLCQTAPSVDDLSRGEVYYPLHVYLCEQCFLVQLDVFEPPENIFGNYLYFSSYSDSWLKHCENYCEMMTRRFGLNEKSFVVEVASNDGYLLQYFVKGHVPALGIEPAANVAQVAVQKGIPTISQFFGTTLARELVSERGGADLVLGNNVLAQVPDLNDFVEGLKILLKPTGVLTLEFPQLLRLIDSNEFDTIYHEHFSYFSFLTTIRILKAHGLRVFDVDELTTHGGSLRVYACRAEDSTHKVQPNVEKVIEDEKRAGLDSVSGYEGFASQVQQTKFALLDFLLTAARQGKSVAGYGAPGKSATLLHYCGIGKDLIQYTVDRSPHKQGRFLPGSRIPIYHPDRISETKPDYVIILPWNLKDEIMRQLDFIREWGGRFVVPIPKVAIY
jgi:C-methyltransferase C-terminal domain/Putative zinc binding domain/Methyltransferase domain